MRIVGLYIFIGLLVFVLAGCRREEPPPPARTAALKPVATPAFFAAALGGQLKTVSQAIERGIDADARDVDRRTALMLASFNGHVDVLRHLLDAGADLGAKDLYGRTALMFASTSGSLETVEELLKRGALVNENDTGERWTPLMFAAAEGHLDIVTTLLDDGADPSYRDMDGDTAHTFAIQRGHRTVAQVLATARANRDKETGVTK